MSAMELFSLLAIIILLILRFSRKDDCRRKVLANEHYLLFVDDTKLSGTVDTLGGIDAIQRDLHRLDKWTQLNLMMLNKANLKILNLREIHSTSID